jgi:hypothetical protein
MKFMALPYVLVNCDLYEKLEEYAVRRRQCDILYRDDVGQTLTIRDRIVSLSVQNKVEYVRLEGGSSIRLDALIELDGMSLPANAYHQQDISGAIERE